MERETRIESEREHKHIRTLTKTGGRRKEKEGDVKSETGQKFCRICDIMKHII